MIKFVMLSAILLLISMILVTGWEIIKAIARYVLFLLGLLVIGIMMAGLQVYDWGKTIINDLKGSS